MKAKALRDIVALRMRLGAAEGIPDLTTFDDLELSSLAAVLHKLYVSAARRAKLDEMYAANAILGLVLAERARRKPVEGRVLEGMWQWTRDCVHAFIRQESGR